MIIRFIGVTVVVGAGLVALLLVVGASIVVVAVCRSRCYCRRYY